MMNSILLGCLVVSFCHRIGKLIIILVHTLNLRRQCTYSQETTSSQGAKFTKMTFRKCQQSSLHLAGRALTSDWSLNCCPCKNGCPCKKYFSLALGGTFKLNL